MPTGKNIYFASDFHLGIPNYENSLAREKKIIRWLESIENDAEIIYLVGDVFDFWFEYKHVVPKNYVRLLGKLATLTDKGIQVEFFTGNHDMWAFDYLTKELNIPVHRSPILRTHQGKEFMIGHGDGLGPGDYGYKFIKKIFANSVCQWLFARLHPNLGIGMANFWSRKSRAQSPHKEVFTNEVNEWLLTYSREQIALNPSLDYFIFGHRHLPLDLPVNDKARYINLGDWFNWCSFAKMSNGVLTLEYFEKENPNK